MNPKLKYIFITFDGYPFPIAKRLLDEGNEVWVSQIDDPKDLGNDSGFTSDEDNEEKKNRRLSIYDGVITKTPLKTMLKAMENIPNKDEYFVIFDFNNLYVIADKVQKMGFTKGLFPTKEDFDREKDRQASKDWVTRYLPDVKVAEVHEFNKVDEAIEFLEEQEDSIFALKSEGNFADTFVPLTDDPDFAKKELIYELQKNQKDWEKGVFTLEEKIIDATELIPEIVFWDGEPVYTQIEFENRLYGAGDVGNQTGGIQNLCLATNIDDPINKMCFPKEVYEMAKKRKGMFIFDCGLLFDREGQAYFTEFAGNRWGWGGVFSELSMARSGDRVASEYFEYLAQGRNPQKHRFGSCVSLYNLKADSKEAGLFKQDMPVQWKLEMDPWFFPYQIRKEDDTFLNVGYINDLLGYTTGCGETVEEAALSAYCFCDKISFKGLYYRPLFDFLCREYVSSIPRKYERFNHILFNGPDLIENEHTLYQMKLDQMKEKYQKSA